MLLLSLPNEVLYSIVKSFVREDIRNDVRVITRFAMTSKRSLLIVEAAIDCKLQYLYALEHRFGKPVFSTSSGIIYALNHRDDLKKRYPEINTTSAIPDLSYLNLDGSLSWLPPFDPKFAARMKRCHQDPAISSKALKILIAEAERLHLRLPAAFLSLMRSKKLLNRFPSACSATFDVGPGLMEYPATADRNAGGYVIKFMKEEQGYWYASLYLDPMGQHCVLVSGIDPHTVDKSGQGMDKTEMMRDYASDATLEITDFEAWLYHVWMNETCYVALGNGTEPNDAQRLYLEHMQRASLATT